VKLKPDFLEGGLSSIDVVILGCEYGSGRGKRSGRPSHFLIGLKENDNSPLFLPVGRVGTGYSVEELRTIQGRTEKSWFTLDKGSVPHFVSGSGQLKKIPECWIHPHDSVVLTVRAYDIQETAGIFTFRFPRVTRLCLEKHAAEVSTVPQVLELKKQGIESRVKQHYDAVELGKRKDSRRSQRLGQRNPNAKRICEKNSGSIFERLHFALYARLSDQDELERAKQDILANGGIVSLTVGSETDVIIEVSPCRALTRLTREWNRIEAEKGEMSTFKATLAIVRVAWLSECLERNTLLPIRPHHVMWASVGRRDEMRETWDSFGDDWVTPICRADLQVLLDRVREMRKTVQPRDRVGWNSSLLDHELRQMLQSRFPSWGGQRNPSLEHPHSD